LIVKNYDAKLKSSIIMRDMILSSTKGSTSHFYNEQGQKIRGWEGRQYKFNTEHPLVKQYR
jgi:hypothetical protein